MRFVTERYVVAQEKWIFARGRGGVVTGGQLQQLMGTLCEAVLKHGVIHVDEDPVWMLIPGVKKTHRADGWAMPPARLWTWQQSFYDFNPSRAGEYGRSLLSSWSCKQVCDDFAGCMTHARRKFCDLYAVSKF